MNFIDKLLQHNSKHIAINNMTYGNLLLTVNQVANLLVKKEINKGDIVFLHGDNTCEIAILWLAGIKVGAVLVLASLFHTDNEINKMNKDAKLKLTGIEINNFIKESVDCSKDFTSTKVKPTDPAIITFTSGTTGESKKVIHTHEVLGFIVKDSMTHTCKPTSSDVFYCTAPLAFMYGLGASILVPLYYGASVVIIGKLTPTQVMNTINKNKVTVLFSSPMFYKAAAKINLKCNSLRYCYSGGEYLHENIRKLWKIKHNKYITNVIGTTEVLWFYAASKENITEEGFLGEVLPGYSVSIKNNEIVVSSPFKTVFTGDNGLLKNNSLFYIGRKDDVIITSGVNINPSEVEEVLLESNLFSDLCIVKYKRFNTEFLRVVGIKAVDIPNNEFFSAVRSYAKIHLPKIKQPKKFTIVKSLPKTFNGKLKRKLICLL